MLRATFPLSAMAPFYASMPDRYREVFDAADAREHAAIVMRRAGAPVHLEVWRRLPKGGAIVCIVADDRPGLLSFISASLVAHGMDIVAAQAYTRVAAEGGGAAEAVDFLWIQRDATTLSVSLPVLRADITKVTEALNALVTGQVTIESIVRRLRPLRPVPRGASTRIRFDESPDAGLVVLTIETFDRPGLLLVITQALFRAGVQIIASDATTETGGGVVDRFTIVELDGTPIGKARRGLVQMELLAAIESLARGNLGA
jgi:UTP:GlnB (protein PII) uridylyltransferase